ncbi:MAG: carbohydrate ABC transporter permease [Spirochaetaceae bacterium]|jgi:multiple sugar transport system permease protein/putative aldouronate transport system permease protein|nr:carbohydrate ABC transporter permease [Spirochaetaceae bacterium]
MINLQLQKKRGMFLRRLSHSDRIFQIAGNTYLIVAGLLVLYPIIYCIACSFSSTEAIFQGRVFLWPVGFTLKSYQTVITYGSLVTGFFNSLLYVAGGTLVAVSLLVLAAYPLSRRDLPFRKIIQTYFVITMFFSGGIIPNYILMRQLGLIGSRWSLIIGFMFSCYSMIIVKSYFQTNLPAGILDAAKIDGCTDVRFFFVIALPLSIPVIAVMVLFNAVGIWNSYFNAMMFLTKSETYSFQLVLRDILIVAQMPPETLAKMDPNYIANMYNLIEQIKYAVLIIGAAPMMILYPFIQKYFIRGLLIGSLKE